VIAAVNDILTKRGDEAVPASFLNAAWIQGADGGPRVRDQPRFLRADAQEAGFRASARFGVWMGKTPRHPMSGWRVQVEAA